MMISNPGNIYFLLFLFFFLFLPQNVMNFPKMINFLLAGKKLVLLLILWMIIFMTTFFNIHPYNQSPYFLRNRLLVFLLQDPFYKIYFYLIAVLGLVGVWVTDIKHNLKWWLFLTTALSLIPINLIEQRYYLIPFAFYILLKEEKSFVYQAITVVLYLTCSLILTSGILTGRFFL